MKYISAIILITYAVNTECGSPDPIVIPEKQAELKDVIVTPEIFSLLFVK